MPSVHRVLVVAALVATLLTAAVPIAGAAGHAELLTDPYLQRPARAGTTVAWVTEFPGATHVVLVGDGVGDLTNRDLAAMADTDEPRARTRGGIRVVEADTIEFERTAEDAASQVAGRAYGTLTPRPVWRHAAKVQGIRPGTRTPYRVLSVTADGSWTASATYSMAPLPTKGEAQQILLTSDHQLRTNTPANLQKVAETVGRVDAVFLAGDLVNIPDRASEWFDDARGGAFFPALQGNASMDITRGDVTTTYVGGEILQYAPIFTALGNHEVMGRVDAGDLGEQYNSPLPLEVAEAAYADVADDVNPSGDPQVKAAWIRDHSYNAETYLDLFDLPESASGGESYYATTFGDVRLISL
jgi:hypothetical protein